MFWICISLMANSVEYFFHVLIWSVSSHLLPIFFFFWCLFCCYCILVLLKIYFEYKSFIIYLLHPYFFLVCDLFFHSLNGVLQRAQILMKFNLLIMLLVTYQRYLCLIQGHKDFPLCFQFYSLHIELWFILWFFF